MAVGRRFRSAVTGLFTSRDAADADPAGTVSERVTPAGHVRLELAREDAKVIAEALEAPGECVGIIQRHRIAQTIRDALGGAASVRP